MALFQNVCIPTRSVRVEMFHLTQSISVTIMLTLAITTAPHQLCATAIGTMSGNLPELRTAVGIVPVSDCVAGKPVGELRQQCWI